jgi:hypothetical protein
LFSPERKQEQRMADPDRRTTDPVQPPGVEGEGMDSYPTYRDGPVPPHVTTGTKPTDTNLPMRKRTTPWPILIGLILFALVIIIRIGWGAFNTARTTDDAMTPGDPATPTATAPASQTNAVGTANTPVPGPETPGSLDRNVQPQTGTGPGAVEATPGAIDVPGGNTTTPPTPP